MKILKTANGNEIKLSKAEWETIGKTAGWIKRSDEEEEEEVGVVETPENPLLAEDEPEQVTFSFGETPEEIIAARTKAIAPMGYSMHIKSQDEWDIWWKL